MPATVWTTDKATRTTTLGTKTRGWSFVEEEKTKSSEECETMKILKAEELEEYERKRKNLKDYIDEAKDMIKSDGGPPRWFTPVECRSHTSDSPLLFYLPGLFCF